MSTTGRSSKKAFCLAAVVILTLATVPSPAFVFALRSQQERLPAELSLADAITIYLERDRDVLAARNRLEQMGAPPADDKDTALTEARLAETRRRGIQHIKEAFHEAVFAQYLIGEAESERQYFDELLEIAQARADVGAAPESDATKVRHERARAEASLTEAKLQLRQAVIRLAGLLGAKDFRRLPEVTGNLNITALNLNLDELKETALRRRSSADTPRERILAEVESAYAAWATHRERAAAIQSTSLPLASDLHAIAHNLYFEKKDGLVNLFEARRSRREVRQKYFRALLDYHLSLALLESAVGKNLSDTAR
ncbi:MAG TPA: TolC family protein [Blastocatellia bacterium]